MLKAMRWQYTNNKRGTQEQVMQMASHSVLHQPRLSEDKSPGISAKLPCMVLTRRWPTTFLPS